MFSDALAAIFESKMKIKVTNYLDDFLFMAESEDKANEMVRLFIRICNQIGCQVSEKKTEMGSPLMIFLGILLD